MNKPDRTGVRQVHVRVNGITFESVRLRRNSGMVDFDVLIDDPSLGPFALTAAVPSLELQDEDSGWRRVTLGELKKILADCGELAEAAETPCESFNALVAQGEHVMNAEAALFREGIPFFQLPFQQDRFASNLFMVRNVAKAKLCLLRAGFQEKVGSETVLFDCRTGKPVQLIEGKCKAQDDSTR